MKRLVPRLDPRLAAELRPQRNLIVKGLAFAVVVGVLKSAPLPLLSASVNTIKELSPVESTLPTKGPPAPATPKADDALGGLRQRLADASDALIGGHRVAPLPRLGIYCLLVVVLFGIKYFFDRGSAVALSKASSRMTGALRARLFGKLQRLPIAYFGTRRAGAIQSVLTNDVNVYASSISVLRDSIEAPISMVIALGYVLYKQPLLAIVGVLAVVPMATVIRRNGRRIKRSQDALQGSLADLSAVTSESLQGVRVIKAFAAESRIERDYGLRIRRTYEIAVENARITAALKPLVELLGAVTVAAVLFLCGWLVERGQLDVGTIFAIVLAFDRINQGIRGVSGITSNLSAIHAATDRIHREVLDVPDQVEDGDAGTILEDPHGRIEFRNVSFAYPDGTEALRDVSFTLEHGTSLALVGPSGAGKSTVADLLLRFYDPTAGQILFDGVDVRDLNLRWLRERIGVVPQQTFLFAGSITDNVRLGRPDATEAQVEAAGRMAHVDEFAACLPARYDTALGEGGSGLSGGQRQRVAIARALVREPALLLLDEATSALDAESERAVTEALDEVMQSRTTLFIAHRLTTAARASRILVMSGGRAVESGTHAELLERGGAYAGLFAAFSGGVL